MAQLFQKCQYRIQKKHQTSYQTHAKTILEKPDGENPKPQQKIMLPKPLVEIKKLLFNT